jgi:hypothetical protein
VAFGRECRATLPCDGLSAITAVLLGLWWITQVNSGRGSHGYEHDATDFFITSPLAARTDCHGKLGVVPRPSRISTASSGCLLLAKY